MDLHTWQLAGLAVFVGCLAGGWMLEGAGGPDRWAHAGRNLALTFLGLSTRSLLASAAAWLPAQRGLFEMAALPIWTRWCVGIAMLDFTGYALHVLQHRVDWLWRFHRVHHGDSELDVTSTYRFHPVDVAVHVVGQLAVVVLLGVPGEALSGYAVVVTPLAFLQHARLRWPASLERGLSWLVITGPAHRLHHSRRRAQADANYSDVLRVWDSLGGTYVQPPDEPVAVGVEGVSPEEEHTLAGMLDWTVAP
jgi:sterol desaturase/sphingolipid hydroxylase (fatty acid hydroxylase superfamily)